MAIPKHYVERYLKKAEGCSFMGQPITDLTRDELIAALMAGWEAESEARGDGMRTLKFMKDLNRRV